MKIARREAFAFRMSSSRSGCSPRCAN